MEVNGDQQLFGYQHSSKYLLLCSTFGTFQICVGTTWGWVNYDKINIFGWTIPLKGNKSVINTLVHLSHGSNVTWKKYLAVLSPSWWIWGDLFDKCVSFMHNANRIMVVRSESSTWYWYPQSLPYGLRVSTEWWSGSVYIMGRVQYDRKHEQAACLWLCGFHCSQIYGSGAWLWIQSSTLTHSLHWKWRI